MRGIALLLLCAALASGCDGPEHPHAGGTPRPYRMGFSAIPPTNDFATAILSLEMWTRRADGAILHVSPPWEGLLAGIPADSLVRGNELGLANYYRAKGLDLVVVLDLTDGLNRAQEAPALLAAGRSLTELAVQQMARSYAVAIDTLVHPSRMLFAAETNLIRVAAAPAVYAAVVQTANAAAADVRARDSVIREGVSIQVEVAWGRLGAGSGYVGVGQDLQDFPFAQDIGLSSYPYLAGFAEPEDVPLDYFRVVADEVARPVLLVEGGWASATLGDLTSSPAEQARWITREAELLDRAGAVGWYQLTFTDLALSAFPQPKGSVLPLFTTLGLVDTMLAPKPALEEWDEVFARPHTP